MYLNHSFNLQGVERGVLKKKKKQFSHVQEFFFLHCYCPITFTGLLLAPFVACAPYCLCMY